MTKNSTLACLFQRVCGWWEQMKVQVEWTSELAWGILSILARLLHVTKKSGL